MESTALIPLSGTEEHKALVSVLKESLYPGAADKNICLVIEYCRQAKLDPMLKPVHIVPIWDRKNDGYRDVVMPGIGLYRIQASRSGCAGISEPDFGPSVTKTLGGVEVTFPEWAKVTVSRLIGGTLATFTSKEYWMENYAQKSSQNRAPNSMWIKRVYGQLGKCAEAQALRKGFPEVGAAPTAEEMEGKSMDLEVVDPETGEIDPTPTVKMPSSKKTTPEKPTVIDVESKTVQEPQEPEAKSDPVESKAPVKDERPISAGALDLIRRRVKYAKKTEADLCKQFCINGKFENITKEQFEKVMAHLKEVAA